MSAKPSSFSPSQEILEAVDDGYLALDANFCPIYANSAAARFVNRTIGDLLGQPVWGLFPENGGTGIEEQFRRVMQERVPENLEYADESRHRRYQLTTMPSESGGIFIRLRDITTLRMAAQSEPRSGSQVRAADPDNSEIAKAKPPEEAIEAERMAGAALDLPERRRLEDALRQSEERFRVALQGSPIIAWTQDTCLRYTWIHNPLAEFGGRMALGRMDGELPLGPPDKLMALTRQVLETGIGTRVEVELQLNTMERWYDLAVEPLRSADGTILGITAAALDITERKQAEQALKTANEALARSNDDLQSFTYTVSHDLQEPLRAITVFTELLTKKYQDIFDAEAEEFAGFIRDGRDRMQSLIAALLDYSRVAYSSRPLKRVESRASLLWAQMNLQASIHDTGAEISSGDLPAVIADEQQLAVVFQNLIDNGIKYRKPGEAPKIGIAAVVEEGMCTFSVSDNGIGIDARYFDRIFRVFHRLHGREIPGTGMGLAVCQRIVERLAGRIWVESVPGEGTTFYFTVPEA